MIEELVIFLIVFIISLFAENMLLKGKRALGPFYPILLRLAFIGVLVHELAHWIMSVLVGSRPRDISIKWRNEKFGYRAPSGSVEPDKPLNFLQSIVVAFAPLYISTWLIFLCFFVMLSPNFILFVRIISGVLCISLILGAAPSTQDLKQISRAFHLDPSHSLYQIALICLSGLFLWLIIIFIQVRFILDVFYYLSIAGIYLVLKGLFIGIRNIGLKISSRDFQKPSRPRMRQFIRTRYKPKKPPKEW